MSVTGPNPRWSSPSAEEFTNSGWTFLGMLALSDNIRIGTHAAVQMAKLAGIRFEIKTFQTIESFLGYFSTFQTIIFRLFLVTDEHPATAEGLTFSI